MGANMYKNYTDNLASEKYIEMNLEALRRVKDKIKGFIFWNLSYNKKTRWEFMEIFNKIRKDLGFTFLELICWNKKHALPISSKKMLTRQFEEIALYGTEEVVKEQIEYYWLGTNEKLAIFNKKKGKGISNYWEINTNNIQINEHKACFPVKLSSKGIRLMTDELNIIYDPFGGSGTTMIASEQLNRRCYMMELDASYCQVIINRMLKLNPELEVKCLNRDFNPLDINGF